MTLRLQKIPLVDHLAALWGQVAEGLGLKKNNRRIRRIDLHRLYWIASPHAVMAGASCQTMESQLDKDVDSADYWLVKGETLIQQERLTEADHCFEQALRCDPQDAYALTYKGYCQYKLGYYEAALACCKQAALLSPRQREINIVRALCLCELHRFEEALACFTKALRYGLESPVLWNNKGFCLARLGRQREASTAFKIALSKCGDESLAILCNAASVLVEVRASNQALRYFDQALQIDEKDHVLLNNVAFCLETLGRHEQALICYEKALLIDPGNLSYLYNQGLCLLRQQRWDRAFVCLKEVVGRDPGNGIAWCGLAAAYLARGCADEALDCYNKALAPAG